MLSLPHLVPHTWIWKLVTFFVIVYTWPHSLTPNGINMSKHAMIYMRLPPHERFCIHLACRQLMGRPQVKTSHFKTGNQWIFRADETRHSLVQCPFKTNPNSELTFGGEKTQIFRFVSFSQIVLVPQGVDFEGEISDKHVFTDVGQRPLHSQSMLLGFSQSLSWRTF